VPAAEIEAAVVEVIAPFGVTREEIESRLLRRAQWVLRQRRYFEQFHPRSPERRYVGGDTAHDC